MATEISSKLIVFQDPHVSRNCEVSWEYQRTAGVFTLKILRRAGRSHFDGEYIDENLEEICMSGEIFLSLAYLRISFSGMSDNSSNSLSDKKPT